MKNKDYNDNELTIQPEPSRRSPMIIIALFAGVAGLLLWMNLNLSSQMSKLEVSIADQQKPVSAQGSMRQLANVSKQMDELTRTLDEHLRIYSEKQAEMEAARSMNAASEETPPMHESPSLSATLPIQPAPAGTMPETTANQSENKHSLPAPISATDTASTKPSSGASWVINLASVSNSDSANKEVARLRKMDINAEASRAESKGKVWYRIQAVGYGSYDEAISARPSLEGKLGISGTWVGKHE